MAWSDVERSVLPRKLYGLPLFVGVCGSLIGCATTGSGRAPTQTVYSANAVAPAVVNTIQLPSRVEWHLGDRQFEADEDVSKDSLLPIQGAHVEAANDLPAQVAQAAAQLAWKEHVDAVYVVRYEIAASSEDDFQTPPDSWKVHLVAREMQLTQDSTEDIAATLPSGDQAILVEDESDAIRASRPKREPRLASLLGVTAAMQTNLLGYWWGINGDISVGKKSIRGHVNGSFSLNVGSLEKVRVTAGAGYALKLARSWVEVEPALFVGMSYSDYPKSWYNNGGQWYADEYDPTEPAQYAPWTFDVEPAVLARWYPIQMLSVDVGLSVDVPVTGEFRRLAALSKLGVGLHF